MEESVKRKERLKAMRMEASQVGVYNDVENSTTSHGLTNPLIETSATLPIQVESCAPPRFDYYTDPMSAFSGNNRSSKVSNQITQDYFTPPRPRNPEMTPSPAHRAQTNYSPDQRMYQAQGPYHSSGPYRSPIGIASTFGEHQGTPPRVWHQTNYSPDQRMYQAQGPYHNSGPYRSPIGIASTFGEHQGTPPRVWNGSGGTSSYCFPSHSSRGGNFSSPGFGQGGSPSFNSGQGRGQRFSNSPGPGSGHRGSPSPNSGRGRGRWLGSSISPGSGRGRGRGLGSRDHVSAELRPDMYYNKSMIEDPWNFLKPVIWRRENVALESLNTPDSLKSWLPKSLSSKKARIFEASNESSSQPSLAEYLAASFNEAVNNEALNVEPSA